MIILKKWVGEFVFVQLKSGRFYDGKVIEVQSLESNPDICLISIYDKLGKEVMFYSNEIEVWESKLPKHSATEIKKKEGMGGEDGV